jgi:hypothetical protein
VALTGKAEERSPIWALLLDLYLVFTTREAERLFSHDMVAGRLEFGEWPRCEFTGGKAPNDWSWTNPAALTVNPVHEVVYGALDTGSATCEP